MNLKDTLNLPKTDFPMRGDLVKREPDRISHWKASGLYARIQKRNQGRPAFVLHDGPPFTNGNVHIGTALNKTLKDTILRYKSMRGFRTPFIPGWDCHGLPIEHKVSVELRKQGKHLSADELRQECASFSRNYIEIQRAQFERLGVLADWANEYRTMNPAYEGDILRTFAAFVEKGMVYRSKKPVYWSIPCETALAEAEVEYLDHKSTSVWVKFPVAAAEAARLGLPEGVSVVIWTTTPWTLPANLAIAVHPELDYTVFRISSPTVEMPEHWIVAQALAESVQSATGQTLQFVQSFKGKELEGLRTQHPFIERESPVVCADYVTTEAGTGCVHTAPGHGMDDYHTGLRYGLEVYCPLDDRGCYTADAWMPKRLVGITVLETDDKCPANIEVLRILAETRTLVAKKSYAHQYPHCWRSKSPVIFRAMDQWFVGIDRNAMRQKVLQSIDSVQWTPDWGIKRIKAAVENRPDWCISRQRSWGVPLPVFFRPDGEALLDASVIRALADRIAVHGTAIWFTQTAAELLSGIPLPEGFHAENLRKGQDTLDVWIDSGCSHRAVLQGKPDLHWPADLYLEGSDQHRGWFQSSIWTGVIADGEPPFRHVLTHGFIVEESGEKISKSKGAMSSDGWVQQFGADVLRLWVSHQDFRGDIRLSENHFKRVQGTYRSIRNTLVYLLGNISDFKRDTDGIAYPEMEPLDQWALMKLAAFVDEATAAYEALEFHQVYKLVDIFVGVTLSRLYHDMLKDRLYTHGRTWKSRRSAQTALSHIFEGLARVCAPVLTFTCDEAWCHYTLGRELPESTENLPDSASIHTQPWPEYPNEWSTSRVAHDIEALLSLRDTVNEKLEALRTEKIIGQSLDARIILRAGEAARLTPLLKRYSGCLMELFIVSEVTVVSSEGDTIAVEASHAEGVRCPRSWRWVPGLVPAGEFGEVSPRDRDALLNP